MSMRFMAGGIRWGQQAAVLTRWRRARLEADRHGKAGSRKPPEARALARPAEDRNAPDDPMASQDASFCCGDLLPDGVAGIPSEKLRSKQHHRDALWHQVPAA